MKFSVDLQLVQRICIDCRFRKVHLHAQAAAEALGPLNHVLEPLKSHRGHATVRCDLDLFAVDVDANNYGELVAGQ